MIVLMAINLYTSRVILEALGVDDYGVYNVVGGFVGMFGFISGALSASISRYLMFELGKNDPSRLSKVFSTSILIQFIISLIVVIIAETIGLWFLNNELKIPVSSISAANWVFQFSLLTFIINLLSVPYNAAIIAHEKMGAFAYIGLFEGIANLLVAFIIISLKSDRLFWYGALVCVVAIITRLIYTIYCKKNFNECTFKKIFEIKLIKEMFSFAGWNFIGNISGILRSQGLNILFNIYYGPIVNAARGLSVQVETAVTKFSTNFFTAIQPQLTKSVANNAIDEASNLACRSSRLAFFLLSFVSLPIMFNIDFILNIWLTEIPDHTSSFVIIILFFSIIESLSQPLIHLILAHGRIRNYQMVVGGIILLNFPIAWIMLKFGSSPELAQASIIFIAILALVARAQMLRKMIGFPLKEFYLNTVLRCLAILSVLMVLCYIISCLFSQDWQDTTLKIVIIELMSIAIIFTFGLGASERNFILRKIHIK